jgi:hypothetical protein
MSQRLDRKRVAAQAWLYASYENLVQEQGRRSILVLHGLGVQDRFCPNKPLNRHDTTRLKAR